MFPLKPPPISFLKYMLKTTKEQRWQELRERLTHVTDAIGCGIDDGILDTVIALNVLSIQTLASCEGHLDHGEAAPWVDVGDPGARPLAKVAYQKLQLAQSGTADERRAAREASEQAKLAVKRLYLAERLKLVPYLDTFYTKRDVSYDSRLVLSSRDWTGIIRLESQGASFQDVFDDDRATNLAAYQAEMQAFTQFLKLEYFSEAYSLAREEDILAD